jgi:hypothetical protein
VTAETQLAGIWRQAVVPVVYRPPEGDLLVKLPYGEDNRRRLPGLDTGRMGVYDGRALSLPTRSPMQPPTENEE